MLIYNTLEWCPKKVRKTGGLLKKQKEELSALDVSISGYFDAIRIMIQKQSFNELNQIVLMQLEILTEIELMRKKQIKRIKNEEAGTKNSLLYLNILQETKNLVLFTLNLAKSQRDFIEFKD